MLLCLDLEAEAAVLAAGTLPCPSCPDGRLASWGHGREREIQPLGGRAVRLRPPRGRCRSCRRTHILLPAWCAPRRAYSIEVAGTAAGLAMAGHGHRAIAGVLAVPDGTVRGWLRRLRANAGQLRQHAVREMNGNGYCPPGPWCEPSGSALGDALNALAAAVALARGKLGYGPEMTWPLIGRLGLARWLMPARAG
jgi:transposase-like protein